MEPTLRDTAKYEPRYLSLGALLPETAEILAAVAMGASPSGVSVQITAGTLLGAYSLVTRQRMWDVIRHRHFSCAPLWIRDDLMAAFALGADRPEFIWLIYLHYTLRDRLTCDLVQNVVWTRFNDGTGLVTMDDGLGFISSLEAKQTDICRWSSSTRHQLIYSIYDGLSEFGLLRERSPWGIVQPSLPPNVNEHILRELRAEGQTENQVAHHPIWHLFLRDREEIPNIVAPPDHGDFQR